MIWLHTTYSWYIKWQKCARMGLNGFQIRWIFGKQDNWKNENPGSRFWATSLTAGSSKTAPRILIFSIVLGAENLPYLKSIETHARAFLTLNILSIGTVWWLMLGLWKNWTFYSHHNFIQFFILLFLFSNFDPLFSEEFRSLMVLAIGCGLIDGGFKSQSNLISFHFFPKR